MEGSARDTEYLATAPINAHAEKGAEQIRATKRYCASSEQIRKQHEVEGA
jgi:hypothetical protein